MTARADQRLRRFPLLFGPSPVHPLETGLIDLVTSGEIGADSTVLYAHLGGQPALNADSVLFR